MNKGSKLLLTVVTVLLLADSFQVECRRTYSSRSSSSGRGNRGKNQPSGSGLFGSWFGGSKSSGSGSGSTSVSKPSASAPKKNWQTATSQVSSQPKTNWANPYYKSPSSAPLPSAPKETSYGWKPATVSNKAGSPYSTSNVGFQGYPVQSSVHQTSQSSFGGFKPASGVPNTNYQPSQSSFGGYRPSANVPNAHGTAYHSSSGYSNPGHHGNFGGYQPAPAHGVSHQPYGAAYHPSTGHHGSFPQQSFSGYQPSHGYSGYSAHSTFAGAAPTYQGTKLFGGNTGHYGYPGSGSWGLDTYGSRKSSGTGKLLTGLAVGAAGGYLTSSLVNSISNPWKYSGYGYGSRYGYGYSPGYESIRTRDESAFERGYERGVRDRLNENVKETVTPSPQPDDPKSQWINCVAFDPQTQQTLINPNCSCTVTTSLDERTGQPISVHHCTTLNGLVMQPIPVQPYQGINSPSLPTSLNGGPVGGINDQASRGVNSPGAVPTYGNAYQENSPYGAVPSYYLPMPGDTKTERSEQTAVTEISTAETKTEQSATETRPEQSSTGSVTKAEVSVTGRVTDTDAVTNSSTGGGDDKAGSPGQISALKELVGGQQENRKTTAEFYGQLQKIVSMGNFVDGG